MYEKALELASLSMINELISEKLAANNFEDKIDKKDKIGLKESE